MVGRLSLLLLLALIAEEVHGAQHSKKEHRTQLVRRVAVSPDGAVLREAADRVEAELRGSRKEGLVIVADDAYRRKYQLQIQSVRCYASAQGYDFWLLRGGEMDECRKEYSGAENFFFEKHCAVAGLLEQQEEGYTLAVLDADVVAVVLDRSLNHWMASEGDLQFYKRIAGEEVMAGNYLARNRPWVRKFLRAWASFQHRRPLGFSSADNGALHQMLLEALELPSAPKVAALYSHLTASVEDLTPYWHFVEAAMESLSAKRWHMEKTKLGAGCSAESCVLSIWPRMSFFVDDGVYLNRHCSSVGPVMHHGIKDPADLSHYFADLQRCVVNATAHVSPQQLGEEAMRVAEGYRSLYQQGTCEQCAQHCVYNFTCSPSE